MAVISNSSPLIALVQIGRLDLLRQLHREVFIPPAVAREVEPTLSTLPGWLVVQPLAHRHQPQTVSSSIGPGEHEVISLGLELRAERLILDEQPARRLAISLGLRVIGTVGLLLGQDLYDHAIGQARVTDASSPTGVWRERFALVVGRAVRARYRQVSAALSGRWRCGLIPVASAKVFKSIRRGDGSA